jgi:hypothetical protein
MTICKNWPGTRPGQFFFVKAVEAVEDTFANSAAEGMCVGLSAPFAVKNKVVSNE